ncbi:MAG: type II secretion system secretin GspD [Pseudomonadota bacterium]|nr:type II secretion system secretin GspD [Pseudomonadota bacterium]
MPQRTHALLFGTLLLLLGLGSPTVHAEPPSGQAIRLNLVDADIKSVIKTVSEITGYNFLVDPRVKGQVTVTSAAPLAPEAVYDVFLSILQVHGFTAIDAGDVIKIVPQIDAKQLPIPSYSARLGADRMVTQVMRLNHVSAAKLIPVLRPLIPKEGHLAAYVPANVLILSDSAANIHRLRGIIESIDLPISNSIEIVTLEKASAVKVAEVLKSILPKAEAGQEIHIVADERSNSLLLSGEASERLNLRSIIQQLDSPIEARSNQKVLYLQYAKAADLAPILNNLITAQQQSPASGGGRPETQINIEADDATNSLIVVGDQEQFEGIRATVAALDIRRAQVLVEAIIVEMSRERTNDLGVQWGGLGGNEDGGAAAAANFFSANGLGIGTVVTSILADAIPPIGDGFTALAGTDNFALMMRALNSNADNNILSTPSILTLDNQEAEIVVGQNVPFVTGAYTQNGDNASNPFQTIERQDVGLTLRVTPQINEGDTIQLKIAQEISSIASTTASAADLITNKRSLDTTVLVDDGQMVALGGLVDDQVTESEQRVPVLSRIPAVGRLFRSRQTSTTKRTLMVFLRPRILRSAADNTAVTQESYELIRGHQLRLIEQSESTTDLPVLKPWQPHSNPELAPNPTTPTP